MAIERNVRAEIATEGSPRREEAAIAARHRSAAALWGIRDSRRAVAEVTAPRKLRPRDRLNPYRVVLPADEVTVHDGIPVTTPGPHPLRPRRETAPSWWPAGA